jgi:hypothetical protein
MPIGRGDHERDCPLPAVLSARRPERDSMIPLATEGPSLPIAETGAVVLVASLLVTLLWLAYLYR